MAHTAAVRVLVADKPVVSARDADFLIRHLHDQIEVYQAQAKYKEPEHRERALGLFRSAITELERQVD
jgi:hypothetical protein